MVSDYEREDIGAAYYRRGVEDTREENRQALLGIARRMRADKIPPETIARYTDLTEEQVRAL